MRDVLGFWIAAYESAYQSACEFSLNNQRREFAYEWAEKEARPRMGREGNSPTNGQRRELAHE